MKQLLARKYFSGNNISQKILQSNPFYLTFLQITSTGKQTPFRHRTLKYFLHSPQSSFSGKYSISCFHLFNPLI